MRMLSLLACAALVLPHPAGIERPWTFLVYGAADNNADGPILEFLDTVREALDDEPGVELVLFVDRSPKYSDDAKSLGEDFSDARIYRLRKSTAERIDPGSDMPELAGPGEHEVDSGNPEMLGKFVTFAKKRFPAKHTALMIYSHADGRGMCPDEQAGSEMRIPELRDRVDAAASVDFLGLELCNMGGIEVAYEWRPGNGGFSANVLVAIPNAGPPLDWNRAFERVRSTGHASPSKEKLLDPSTMTAADLGKLVIEEGKRGRELMLDGAPERMKQHLIHEAAGCYDLAAAADVKKAVDTFVVALAGKDEAARDASKRAMLAVRDGSIDYSGGNLEYAPYFDLYKLCARAAASEALSKEARDAAKRACEAVDRFVLASFGMKGLEGFEDGKSGVFIVFPDGDAQVKGMLGGTQKLWSRFRWYSPLDAKEKSDPYGRWAFLRDGATPGNGIVENWYELLDAWFDPVPKGDGGTNGYRW